MCVCARGVGGGQQRVLSVYDVFPVSILFCQACSSQSSALTELALMPNFISQLELILTSLWFILPQGIM